MPESDLGLIVRREEGVLVRVLGLVVRRGFEPVRVHARRRENADTMDLDITLAGDRAIESLVKQLEKLYEVEEVRLLRSK